MMSDEKLRTFASGFHLVFFGLVLPLAALRVHRRMATGAKAVPDPKKHFRGATIELATLMAASIVVAWTTGIDLLAFDSAKLLPGLAAGAAMYAATVAYMRPRWRRAVESRAPIVRLFMPRTRASARGGSRSPCSRGSARRSRGAACRRSSLSRSSARTRSRRSSPRSRSAARTSSRGGGRAP
jgi:hypothetical protein